MGISHARSMPAGGRTVTDQGLRPARRRLSLQKPQERPDTERYAPLVPRPPRVVGLRDTATEAVPVGSPPGQT